MKKANRKKASKRLPSPPRGKKPVPRKEEPVPVLPNEAYNLSPLYYAVALAWLGNGFNGAEAYRSVRKDATDNTARVEAHRILTDVNTRRFLAQRLEEALGPFEMAAGEAVARIGAMARADIRQLFDQNGKLLAPQLWPAWMAQAVLAYEEGKVRLVNPLQALTKVLELTGRLKNPLQEMGDALADALKQTLAEHAPHRLEE